jgi:hypothetical protein
VPVVQSANAADGTEVNVKTIFVFCANAAIGNNDPPSTCTPRFSLETDFGLGGVDQYGGVAFRK